ncbi:alpha-N-arabinofuranosidase [Olivibacter ginsenosidimutans]|uniref:non-reducing end alpha-L-arabinofuranosidase n=1 Tax=Olivibacter ginsenosidimutans TaxID=1176537 RepID=A0ABP9BUZ4_9SPHI
MITINLAKMQQKKSLITITACAFLLLWNVHTVRAQVTQVSIRIPDTTVLIDPMIYGQMLENVNDSMIYGGVADRQGNVRQHLVPLLQDLQIPVMRWPGGTVVYEYDWKSGIGPREKRPTEPNLAWGGTENYQFGTDEFLQWCRQIGTTPYINLNMSLHPDHPGTVTDALEWMEYVNGKPDTKYGRLRAQNGHPEPYGVKYWGVGNENYLNNRAGRVQETDAQYALRLKQWATSIKQHFPELQLLGIGHTHRWNQRVLDSCGQLVDFLTQHYYVTSRVKDGKIQQATRTLFAPAKMEAHLAMLGAQLDSVNQQLGRSDRPIRLSVDEWNNRHSVNNGDQFTFTRQSPRRQFDVAVAAGMLNAFIRQSPHVGMANYIFPVNAHGQIRTVGNTDAYRTPVYHVFQFYRTHLTGSRLALNMQGPSIAASSIQPTIDGDSGEAAFMTDSLLYVDGAAVLTAAKTIQLSLVNRSPDKVQKVAVHVPAGYKSNSVWILSHPDINAANSENQRNAVEPLSKPIKAKRGKVTLEIPPCGLYILELVTLNTQT